MAHAVDGLFRAGDVTRHGGGIGSLLKMSRRPPMPNLSDFSTPVVWAAPGLTAVNISNLATLAGLYLSFFLSFLPFSFPSPTFSPFSLAWILLAFFFLVHHVSCLIELYYLSITIARLRAKILEGYYSMLRFDSYAWTLHIYTHLCGHLSFARL